MAEYFYNTRTREVEEGRNSDWSQLMGPYATREEAQHALDIARARNEEWDQQDES
ncbi:SPOR domain-containing protein [Cellulomonas sp. S1-8]|uniref:SPOR domain-containing protein n=1 Tax=Cellulomonas sp. S1-8 TaxID=2904790 RepID=UPI00224309CA|nr:SPOR domain-containing protein [Cellulomonas sp. S1-8]UZN01714.1 SPOR domain-containing protein [Cellulomonas sp. S1-8]